jgi:hypothetical protein
MLVRRSTTGSGLSLIVFSNSQNWNHKGQRSCHLDTERSLIMPPNIVTERKLLYMQSTHSIKT